MFLFVLAWVILIPLLGMAAFSVFKSKMLMFERMMGRKYEPVFNEDDFNVEEDM